MGTDRHVGTASKEPSGAGRNAFTDALAGDCAVAEAAGTVAPPSACRLLPDTSSGLAVSRSPDVTPINARSVAGGVCGGGEKWLHTERGVREPTPGGSCACRPRPEPRWRSLRRGADEVVRAWCRWSTIQQSSMARSFRIGDLSQLAQLDWGGTPITQFAQVRLDAAGCGPGCGRPLSGGLVSAGWFTRRYVGMALPPVRQFVHGAAGHGPPLVATCAAGRRRS